MAHKDLDIIAELEKKLDIKLVRTGIDEINWSSRAYAIDEDDRVVGLGLYGMVLSDLSPLAGLSNLSRLKLSRNRVTDLSPLAGLNALTDIDLSSNQLDDISPLTNLKKLTLLDLIANNVSDLAPLAGLTELTDLYLSENRISDLAPLTGLKELTGLHISDNKITDISPLAGLARLDTVILTNNNISHLPPGIADWPAGIEIKWTYRFKESGIFLENNPLVNPPVEIIEQGREAVRAYFRSLKGEQRPLNEVKVLLVGDGGAGKTSLVKQLLEQDFDPAESQTHGIDIENRKVEVALDPEQDTNIKKKIKVHFWDFGGQEIMHATHRFFLTKRCLYILVIDGRRDEKIEYWFKHIRSFGGDSPVLVVMNKIDQNPRLEVNRSFLRQKYPNIKGFIRLSCATREGITDFKQHLTEALAQLESTHTLWPENWFRVKKRLEEMEEDYISLDTYRALCKEENIQREKERETLLDFLHDLGIVLYFRDFVLQDTLVLKPEWVTGAVYKIINSPELAKKQGVLELSMLDAILEKQDESDYDYPPKQYPFIIGLMEKFEICYPLDMGRSVLVPDLLAVWEPDIDFDYDDALRFIVEYKFLPRSVLPRFIVNMNKDIQDRLYWRSGVVLANKDFRAKALVRTDHEERRVYIYVTGPQKRDYFAVLLYSLKRINESFEKLETRELVPMPDDPRITAPYNQLIKFEQRGIEYYVTGESDKEYRIKDLLGTITGEKSATEEEILAVLKRIANETTTKESLEKLNETFILQPRIFGVGIDLKNLAEKALDLMKRKKQNKKQH